MMSLTVLRNPKFQNNFTLRTVTETVDAHGRTHRTSADTQLTGVVLPATDKQLDRLPDDYRTTETIAIYAEHQLTPGGPTAAPMRILWRGGEYEVVQVKDFMAVAGFCEALASSATPLGRG